MKNLLLLFFFAFTTSLSAQKFGIRAGVNLASQSFGDGDVDAGSIVGYQVGINYEILTILNLAIRPGLLYATKGSSQEFPDLTEEARFHYFEVPVDIVYDLGVVDIFAGPYMGYALKGTQDVGAEVVNINFDKDNVKKLDIGLNFGANIDINDMIYLGAYYSLGVSDLNSNDNPNLGSDESIKNKSISTFVALRF